jgi:hypothetical protein
VLGNDITDRDVLDLVEKVGVNPLELYQAASYLFQTNTSWERYFKLLSERATSSSAGTRISQGDIWRLTKVELEKRNPVALEWLRIFSCLNGKHIPANWMEMDRDTRNNVLQLLLGYGLIRYDTESETIFLHDRIAEMIQREAGHAQIEQRAIGLVRQIGERAGLSGDAFALWVPHAQKMLSLQSISTADREAIQETLSKSD